MKKLRALIVEDSENDAFLILRYLERNGYEVHHRRVYTVNAFELALAEEKWDVLLCDYFIPGFGALAALEFLKQKHVDLPFIVVSGAIGEEIAVHAMKCGAHDYVMKDNLPRLAPAIERELREAEMRRERKKAQDVLAYLATIVEFSDDAIIGTTLEGMILSWNTGAEKTYDYTANQVKGRSLFLLLMPEHRVALAAMFEKLRMGERIDRFETAHVRKDGSEIHVSLSLSPIKTADGHIAGASFIARDITARKQAEEERERIIAELNDALGKVKTLTGLLPICSCCKRIRDDRGYWQQVEKFIHEHSRAEFSHGICPDCMETLYPEFGPHH